MCKRDSATCMLTLMWHAPNGNVTAMTTQQQLYIHISQCHFTGFYRSERKSWNMRESDTACNCSVRRGMHARLQGGGRKRACKSVSVVPRAVPKMRPPQVWSLSRSCSSKMMGRTSRSVMMSLRRPDSARSRQLAGFSNTSVPANANAICIAGSRVGFITIQVWRNIQLTTLTNRPDQSGISLHRYLAEHHRKNRAFPGLPVRCFALLLHVQLGPAMLRLEPHVSTLLSIF